MLHCIEEKSNMHELPPCDYVPPTYDGPSKDEVMQLRKQFLTPALITFYQDPVMPGSLGIEALFEAIQLFALQEGLGANIVNASFDQAAPHRTVWKYRGQILQHDPLMNVEVNIKEVKDDNGKVIIIADGSLWKGTLRIYEVTDMSITIS